MIHRPIRQQKSRIAFAFGIAAVTAVCAASVASAGGHAPLIRPFVSVFYTDSTSGPVVEGIQNGSGDGVEGVVGATAGAIGMLGYGNNAAIQNIGLEGLVNGPNSVGLLGQALSTNAATPSVGLEGTSANGFGVVAQSLLASGAGLLAEDSTASSKAMLGIGGGAGALASAVHSNGVVGQTSNPSLSSLVSFSGVLGVDTSSDGGKLNAGLAGTSTNGVGVSAFSTANKAFSGSSGTNANGFTLTVGTAMLVSNLLSAPNGIGIVGTSNNGNGLLGGSASAAGVEGDAFTGAPAFAGFNLAKGPTFIGVTENGAHTVFSTATIGATGTGPASGTIFNEGLLASGDIGVEADGSSATAPALIAKASGGGPVFIANNGANDVLSVDNAGNLIAKGTITTGTPLTFILSGTGRRLLGYSARQTQPTMEDFGEAELRAGQSFVALDPKFADTIDHRTSYMVFITPEGDNRGLYVAQKLPNGFLVRESQGGRSTLAFSYRIVAKPVDLTVARLPDAPALERGAQSARTNLGYLRHPAYYRNPSLVLTRGSVQPRTFAVGNVPRTERVPHADRNGNVHLGPVTVRPH